MVFSAPFFLFIFLPLTIVGYYATPRKFKNLILLLASCVFYAYGGLDFLAIFFLSTIIDYVVSMYLFKTKFKKISFILALIFNLGLLFYFKYSNFFIEQISALLRIDNTLAKIMLPLGISFFTFHKISYLCDIYLEKEKTANNFFNYALYLFLFPQLVAGPIVRFHQISEQLEHRKHSFDIFFEGIYTFVLGLAMKVLIADPLGEVFAEAMHLQNASSTVLMVGILCYSFQLYFDFAGYSKMAIGLGQLFGFHLPINFNRPYLATSITEFWHRWHISLSSFLKEYVYFPLGGNRKGKIRTAFNLFFVFLLTGIWHGANWTFFIWGIYFGILIVLEKFLYGDLLKKIPVIFSRLLTFILVAISWVLFQANSLENALGVFGRIFSFENVAQMNLVSFNLRNQIILLIAVVLSLFALENKLLKKLGNNTSVKTLVIVVLFTVSLLSIAGSTYHPFLYFRF